MGDMVPRSRLAAVEHELEKAEQQAERVADNATIEIERLTAENAKLRGALDEIRTSPFTDDHARTIARAALEPAGQETVVVKTPCEKWPDSETEYLVDGNDQEKT